MEPKSSVMYYVKSGTRIAEQVSICVFIKQIHFFISYDRSFR